MKKTSRRTLGKQSRRALATTDVTAPGAKGDERTETSQRPKAVAREKIFKTHDTPPPLEFINGSFVIEKQSDFDDRGLNSGTDRYEYISGEDDVKIVPAHIKIVEGNGEVLYRNETGKDCEIVINLQDETDTNKVTAKSVSLNAETKKFVIDLHRSKRMTAGILGNNDKPSSRKRSHRFRHSGGSSLSMYKITVKQGSTILYTVFPGLLAARGEDLKVMIWLEDEVEDEE